MAFRGYAASLTLMGFGVWTPLGSWDETSASFGGLPKTTGSANGKLICSCGLLAHRRKLA